MKKRIDNKKIKFSKGIKFSNNIKPIGNIKYNRKMKYAKNMSISKKLGLAFSMVIAVFLIVIIVNLISVFNVGQSLNTFYENPYKVVSTALDMRRALNGTQRAILSTATTQDFNKVTDYLQEMEEYTAIVDEGIVFLEEKFSGDQELVKELKRISLVVNVHREELIELAKRNKNERALEVYFSGYEPSITKMRNKLLDIQEVADAQALSFYQSGKRTQVVATISVIVISLAALATSIWICIKLSISLIRPIQDIENAAQQMAEGNLKTVITYEGNDELGHLAQSLRSVMTTLGDYVSNIDETLNQIASKNMLVTLDMTYIGDFAPIKDSMLGIARAMRETLSGVSEVAKQVASGSEQLSMAGQALAEGAAEQSSAVQQLLAMINEVSETVTGNAKMAVNVADMSENGLGEIENSNVFMAKLLEEMEAMTNQAKEVASIIKVVEGISAQTNLLSLNATIEAARAGEHGAGFAVVANEIGKLANESTKATKDIAELIGKTITVVERSVKIADETSLVLKKMVHTSKETSHVVGDIAKASSNQAEALSEVVEGVHQIAGVVESNSSIAEETSASSEELLAQAEVVTELLNQFKL